MTPTKFMVLYNRDEQQLRVVFTRNIEAEAMTMLDDYFHKQMKQHTRLDTDIKTATGEIFKDCSVITIQVPVQHTVDFMMAWREYFKHKAMTVEHVNN